MLKQLCEGHNTRMQNYLREQRDNLVSIDLVRLTVEVLHVLSESIDSRTLVLVSEVCSKKVFVVEGIVTDDVTVL